MFENLSPIDVDPIFKMWCEFQKDTHPQKQNLSIGIYSDLNGHPYVMPSVQKASQNIQTQDFNYVSMNGNRSFLTTTAELILGDLFHESNCALQQTCGGTQALHIYAQLCEKEGYKTTLFSDPTWPNHHALFKNFDQKKVVHLNPDHQFNTEAYKEAISQVDNQSILLLQGGPTHNPCGINYELSDIEELIPLIREKGIAVCIDTAYLGFGDGITQDSKIIKVLWEQLEKVSIAVSFSKNGCLYRHRAGALLCKTKKPSLIESHMQVLIRESISNPPAFGAEVMEHCLKNNQEGWRNDLEIMRSCIEERKNILLDALPESFQYLRRTKGMFGILPIQDADIDKLRNDYGIYLPKDKRINFAGIQTRDIEYITKAFSSL